MLLFQTTTTSIQLTSLVTSEEVPIRDEEANVIKEGQIRLVNGRTDREVSKIDFVSILLKVDLE